MNMLRNYGNASFPLQEKWKTLKDSGRKQKRTNKHPDSSGRLLYLGQKPETRAGNAEDEDEGD